MSTVVISDLIMFLTILILIIVLGNNNNCKYNQISFISSLKYLNYKLLLSYKTIKKFIIKSIYRIRNRIFGTERNRIKKKKFN